VQTAVYLLPLRHPAPVARQVVSVAQLAPGRFTFGVGLGGDDRSEYEACGVDPRMRGARMDESLLAVRALLTGDRVGGTSIRPSPSPPVPIVVGGRSTAAQRRAGRVGDGWLAVFVSPERFAAGVAEVDNAAAAEDRSGVVWDHGVLAWCGIGTDVAPLATAMESLYQRPFRDFERYAPHGEPRDVARALEPYVHAGARTVLLSPFATDEEDALAGAALVAHWLKQLI
jgi:alkanesulfonate monooxygenase SsuD/methylene tetrahydromethanopterin reductase-like flavin-dependent oxidoreductase (luciferase family)